MIAKVQLWGRTIGAVSLDEGRDVAAFQYDTDFAHSGIELSPLVMSLSERVYEFPALRRNTFHGLPEDEIAFYDALATNDSAVQAMGDAKLEVMVKRILNKHGYPPDL